MANKLQVPRQSIVQDNDVSFGVCLWKLPSGGFVQNSEGDYFCCQGRVGDRSKEEKMRRGAQELGVFGGKPEWRVGARKISQSEYEDEMEAMLEGENPDPVDLYRQLEHGI